MEASWHERLSQSTTVWFREKNRRPYQNSQVSQLPLIVHTIYNIQLRVEMS